MIEEISKILSQKVDLSSQQMTSAMEEIMSGKAALTAMVEFLSALSAKGETVEELTSGVKVLRRHLTPINSKQGILLDTCGTGGDTKGTFNISTVVAFVVSGCGVAVAKHGNRAVSSCCGSADVFEALGIDISMPKDSLEKCLNEIGIVFLFAQSLHPAMKFAREARKQIGKRTIFNMLGPLTNPANARHQLIGVYDRKLTQMFASVLLNSGSKHALVVHGEDGLDEVTTTAKTFISELKDGKIMNYEVTPEDFGLRKARLEELKGGTIQENVEILLEILNGQDGPRRDIVLLNSAAALYAADKVSSIKEGINMAAESIDSRSASKKLEMLTKFSLS